VSLVSCSYYEPCYHPVKLRRLPKPLFYSSIDVLWLVVNRTYWRLQWSGLCPKISPGSAFYNKLSCRFGVPFSKSHESLRYYMRYWPRSDDHRYCCMLYTFNYLLDISNRPPINYLETTMTIMADIISDSAVAKTR
jgi:hypothetical protein